MYIKRNELWMFDGIEGIKEMKGKRLANAVKMVSQEIDEYCHTRFEPTEDAYTIDLQGKFYTRRRPLLEVLNLSLRGCSLIEGVGYFVYPESAKIEINQQDSGQYKKALHIKYLFGYEEIPATVKQVAVELVKLDAEAKSFQVGGLQSENWDGEYAYTRQNSKDFTPAELRKNILARLDIFKEEPYRDVTNARMVRARLV